MASAARQTGAVRTDNDPAWLEHQTGLLIAAVRANDADEVYRIAGDAAERTLDSGSIFTWAAKFAQGRKDWGEAVRFATLDHFARPLDAGSCTLLIDLLKSRGAEAAAGSVLDRALAARPRDAELVSRRIALALDDTKDEAEAVIALFEGPPGERISSVERIVQALIQRRAFRTAEVGLEIAGRRHGAVVPLRRLAAQLAHRSGALEQADRLWQALAQDAPETARQATLFRARIAVEREAIDDALRHYDEALEREPTNVEAARYMVRTLLRQNRVIDAAHVLERHRAAAGETATVALLDTLMLVAAGRADAAVQAGEAAIARFPVDAELALRIADLHSDGGDWPRAAKLLDDALERCPADFNLLARRVRAAETLDQNPASMLALVERARAIRPLDQSMMRSEANLLARLGDRRRAVAAAIAALDHHPSTAGFWRVAIANLLNLNEPVEAALLLERARSVFATDTLADLLGLSEILESAERVEEAAAVAAQAITLDPSSANAQMVLARQRVALGDYRGALTPLTALRASGVRLPAAERLMAQVSRAIAYVDARASDPDKEIRFPNAIFDCIAAEARPRPLLETEPVVVHVSGSLGAGGAERQVALTVRELHDRESGLRPLLAVYDATAGSGRDFFMPAVREAAVDVVELRAWRGEGAVRDFVAEHGEHRGAVALLATLPVEAGAVALPLYALLVTRRARVVHLWQDATCIAGGIAAMLAGVPRIVLGTRSTRPVERQRVRPWLQAGYDALVRYPGTIILNNSANGTRDYEDWLGLAAGSIAVVHNGFDFAAMRARAQPSHAEEIRASLGIPPDGVLFGGVMRLSFEKRPELWTAVAIALARRESNFYAVLVGEGPMREPLLAMIAAAGLSDRIMLVGRQAPVEPWMATMDLLFLSSLTEGLPNVLIEAQALGLPVATMRVGGAPETVLEDKTAIVVDEGTPEEIATRIFPLIADAALRAQFGRAAAEWAESSFSAHAMIDRLDALYAATGA